jgi:hypothetical protein
MDAQRDIDRELKELERDKRAEELRQLRGNSRIRWITPAALAALLPLLAGFGVWAVSEFKEYNEGYRALAERNTLRQEKAALQAQKDSLNIEVSTLLQLKAHYAGEAEQLRRETVDKQDAIDKNYLRGVFASDEALYALDHIKGMGPPPGPSALATLRSDAKQLPGKSRDVLEDMLGRYEMSVVLINVSREVIAEFQSTQQLLPAAAWTRDFHSMPTGALLGNRKIMFKNQGKQRHYYDVMAGRMLSSEETAAIR